VIVFLRDQETYDFMCPGESDEESSFYLDKMQEYADFAHRRFSLCVDRSDVADYATCIAFAFCEELPSAVKIFHDCRLTAIHAYALLGDKIWFVEELDDCSED
jgi:hypothetical protein